MRKPFPEQQSEENSKTIYHPVEQSTPQGGCGIEKPSEENYVWFSSVLFYKRLSADVVFVCNGGEGK